MALCSFGGVSDQCGATSWAAHEMGMVPLLSSKIDMTVWLKEKYKGLGAYKWLLLRSSGLFLLNRDHDMLPFCGLKLFVCDEDFPI